MVSNFSFFFFQAEDGIRDKLVTGVQTCALPISRARNGKKSLLIGQLTAAGARLAGLNARALLRAGALACLAVFLARQLDLGGHPRGRFFERERHVVS